MSADREPFVAGFTAPGAESQSGVRMPDPPRHDRGRFHVTPQVVFGLIVAAVGLILTAGNLGWIDSRRWLRHWPLAIVALGVAKVLGSASRSGRLFGGLLMFVGLWISSGQFLRVDLRLWSPLILVLVGVLLISRAFERRHQTDTLDAASATDASLSAFAFWSGVRRRVASPVFRRADLSAIMGGIELDLRAATTAGGEAVIDVFAMWGGIEITVPGDWQVVNEVVAIMGGVDDKSTGTPGARHRLVLRGFAIMGGVDVKT
jgi:predicted membrane protein